MSDSPYNVTRSREVYKNRWITLREDQVTRQDAADTVFGVITMKAGSSILPVSEDLSTFLVTEYKYGIGRYSTEVVSGALEASESPLDAARRELEEELGIRAGRWIAAGKIDPFTTIVNSPNYLFLALGLERTVQRLDQNEVLTIEEVSLAKAVNMVMEGEITHGASCVLILKARDLLGI